MEPENKAAINLLKKEAAELNIALNNKQLLLFDGYLTELQHWNKKINITAITETDEIIIKHFIDSLVLVNLGELCGKLADIGSGGGFPGIPLKIAKPELFVVLIESKRKKANFMRHILRKMGLSGVEVFNGRSEEFKQKEYFDCAVSRAFADVQTFWEHARPLLKKGGRALAMKGKNLDREKLFNNFKEKQIGSFTKKTYVLPFQKGLRTLIIMQKCFT